MKRLTKLLLFYGHIVLLFGLLYLGSVGAVEWARNIIVFVVWAEFAVSAIALIGTVVISVLGEVNGLRESDRIEMPRAPQPGWLTTGLNIAFALALASLGWFVLASAWLLDAGMVALSQTMTRSRNERIDALGQKAEAA